MEYRFDFDDQLPDLPIAFDFDKVAELFDRKLFRPASPQDPARVLSIKKLQDLKYRPSERCVTTYEMLVGKANRSPEWTIGVLEFTPEGVLPRIFTTDDRLPWLARATDMNEMQRLFSELPGYEGRRSYWRSSRFVTNPVCTVSSAIRWKRLLEKKCSMENPSPEMPNGS